MTVVAVLGGVGLLPSAADQPADSVGAGSSQVAQDETSPAPAPSSSPQSAPTQSASSSRSSSRSDEASRTPPPAPALPAESGTGRRVVFSESEQRVWLVAAGDRVRRTYLVSGSVYDNLDPGTYAVYSRSEQAWGIDDSGSMRYFVRFTQGESAAIGFHDIPVDDGSPVQTAADLGTPQSHGCIRQRRPDAIALWRFAPLGTTVVVTA